MNEEQINAKLEAYGDVLDILKKLDNDKFSSIHMGEPALTKLKISEHILKKIQELKENE